jgi:hypothetical protein
MSVHVLEALADAIYNQEGNRPPYRAYRNRNPGNLRPTDPSQARDESNYRVFDTFVVGYLALQWDLLAKVTGHTMHDLNIDSTIMDFANVWAPSSDNNQPYQYAIGVAHWMSKALSAPIGIDSSFRTIFSTVGQELPVYVKPPTGDPA